MNRLESFWNNSLFSTVQIQRGKYFFLQFLLIFWPLDPDPWIRIPHIFADPGAGSQNVTDLTDL